MSDGNKPAFLNDQLSKRTSIFGLRLWVVLGICVGAAIVLFLFIISLWFTSRRHKKSSVVVAQKNPTIPNVSKEIQEIRVDPSRTRPDPDTKLLLLPAPVPDPLPEPDHLEEENSNGHQRIHIEIGKGHRIAYPERVVPANNGSGHGSGDAKSGDQVGIAVPEVSHLGWGHWYTLRELELSTNGFADENVIGEGGYGIVYSGVLEDNTNVAVKNLLNNRYKTIKVLIFCEVHSDNCRLFMLSMDGLSACLSSIEFFFSFITC